MDNEPEVIRRQMSDTRASLTEKLETLEQQVVDTVQGATATVTQTVENVKDAVQDTVQTVKGSVQDTLDTVKNSLDLNYQAQQHPWLVFGGSMAAGFAAGYLLQGQRQPHAFQSLSDDSQSAVPWPTPTNGGTRHHFATDHSTREVSRHARDSGPSWFSELSKTFSSEINQLKGLALGTLVGVIRDAVSRNVPGKIAPQLAEVLDSFTNKLGGQPIRGPVLEEAHVPASSTAREHRCV